jgi:hypothetical protein
VLKFLDAGDFPVSQTGIRRQPSALQRYINEATSRTNQADSPHPLMVLKLRTVRARLPSSP